MPSSTVDRSGRGVEGHLAAAAEYIAIAESGDAEKSAYEHAADEIIAAMGEDPSLTFSEVDRRLNKSGKSDYSGKLVRWRKSGRTSTSPWARTERSHQDGVATRKVAREHPDLYVEAFRQAPAEARQQIAREISRAPEVRAEARRHDVETEQRRQPNAPSKTTNHTLFEFESKLVGARRYLRDALALVDGIDQPGDDEDVLELLTMLKQLVDVVDEAYRSGKSLDTWAWELFERSAD